MGRGCNVVKNVRSEGPFILSFASYVKQSVHVGAFALLSNEMFSVQQDHCKVVDLWVRD